MIGIVKEKRLISDILKSPPLSWKEFFNENYDIVMKIENDINMRNKEFFPSANQTFRIFYEVALEDINVVILGQDPYPTKGDANGFAFSCNIHVPRSLKNIYKSLEMKVKDFIPPNHGNLYKWVKQGVFLYNTALSVEEGTPKSHIDAKIWNVFTENLMTYIKKKRKGIVYILWGGDAKKFLKYIDDKNNLVLSCHHPSPMVKNSDFLENDHFNKANEYLSKSSKFIDWILN